jgi:HEAT repeat protein
VQRYVALEGESDPQRRVAGLRELTLDLLRSDEPRLAASALRDLVRSGTAPLVTRQDLPRLTPVLEDVRAPVGFRAGLLAELERRGLLEGDAHWVRLLETARAADLPAAIRAAGTHPSPAVNARIVELLATGDPASAEAAAVALGAPGNRTAVEPLSAALAQGDARLRMAAIRGLGRIALPESRRALESAAKSHADPATRRRAAAELRIAQSGT